MTSSKVYLSAEQIGVLPHSVRPATPRIIAAAGGTGSLEAQAQDNASRAMMVLVQALRDTGRRITPRRLDNALDRAVQRMREPVVVRRY